MKIYDANMNQLSTGNLTSAQKSVYERFSYFSDADATMYTDEPKNLVVPVNSRAIVATGYKAAIIKSNYRGKLDVHNMDWTPHTKWSA